jgi:hypothetical protein
MMKLVAMARNNGLVGNSNRFKPTNTKCTTFKYIGENGEKVEKPKKQFNSEEEAFKQACYYNAYGTTIHKLSAYKCWSCGKWHIGRTPHVLTKEDREKYKQRLAELNRKG